MTNKLVVIINSLKVPEIKKILLYEMKFIVPNYSCLQNPWLGGYRPPDPRSLSSTEFVEPPPPYMFRADLPLIPRGTFLYIQHLVYVMRLCWLAAGRIGVDPTSSPST